MDGWVPKPLSGSSLQRLRRAPVNILGLTLCGAHPISQRRAPHPLSTWDTSELTAACKPPVLFDLSCAMSRREAGPSRITLLNHFDVLAPSGDDESWWSEGSKDFSDDLELSGVGHVIRPAEQVLLKSTRLRRFQSAVVDNEVVWSSTSLHVSLLMHWLGQSEHVSLLILVVLIDVDMS